MFFGSVDAVALKAMLPCVPESGPCLLWGRRRWESLGSIGLVRLTLAFDNVPDTQLSKLLRTLRVFTWKASLIRTRTTKVEIFNPIF